MTVFMAILQSLIAIPKIGAYIEKLLIAIAAWQTNRSKEKTKELIQNAKKASNKSKLTTKEARIEAAKKWREVFEKGERVG